MCGIAGIYNPNGLTTDPAVVRRMSRAIAHRGPDEAGYHIDPRTHLASRRLSIIDLATGAQPIYSQDKNHVIVYNGEIYNFAAIREELRAHGSIFETHTDTEVILQAYRVWGPECLQRLRGMFAFCILDDRRKELFLARDRLGIKPLVYSRLADGTFLFASEIKALLRYPGITKRLYPQAVDNLLSYGFNVAPHTFFDGIKQVLPGQWLRVSAQGIRSHTYWDIDMDRPQLKADEEEIARELRRRIEASVAARLVADVPVAAYLSGGIDSSAVAGIYSRQANARVKTVSITFDAADYDESAYSRRVSQHFETENIEFKCRIDPGDIHQLIHHLEEPMMTLLNLPLWLLSRQVRRSGFKVVLSGDGADEILGGYDYFKLLKIMDFIARRETPLRKSLLRRCYPGLKNTVQANIQHMLMQDYPVVHPALPYRFQRFAYKNAFYSEGYKETLDGLPQDNPFIFDVDRIAHRSLMDQALYIETKMRLLNLTLPLGDKMSMANSVELRPVFLDHDLVDFVFRIPDKLKIRGLNEKYILKRSMQGFLPDEICRRTKQPLQPPCNWFVRTAGEMLDDYLSPAAVGRKGYFNPQFVTQALENARSATGTDAAGIVIVAFFVHLWDDIFLNS